ncbi:MAG: phage tail protein [Verrucomicrobia bacterium]|nr:phage tail protein [Verrucomicrobiota bacterium]
MAEPFLGEIRLFGFNFPPTGWAPCDGRLLSIAQNTALFALLGTSYGGDGQTTFGLPDLRSRVPINQGAGPGLSFYTIGQAGGVEQVSLSPAQIPTHNHSFACQTAGGNAQTPKGNFLAVDASGLTALYSTTENATMAPAAVSNTGQNQGHTNLQPYLVLNFCIALAGIFPARQ